MARYPLAVRPGPAREIFSSSARQIREDWQCTSKCVCIATPASDCWNAGIQSLGIFEERKWTSIRSAYLWPNIRLKIFTEMEADLEARFLELLKLRERVRQAEQRARRPAPVVITAIA
jgi:hypothetical protein